jgi:ABC-2 type transport system ATP-binding protein
MSRACLSIEDVTLCYGEFIAVDGLRLEVRRGEVLGLLGPNGCGKSTTLSAVTGAMPLSAGEIRVCGARERDDPIAYRRQIGLVPQEPALFDVLTAEQNLRFFGRLYGLGGRELSGRVAEVLKFVSLGEQAKRTVRTLSGGMQRRLNLAAALLHRPALLLLDEPTAGLDIQSRQAVFAGLRELRDQGCGLVFATHHLEEAELLCDRIGVMDRGRLVALGALEELVADLPEEDERTDGAHGAAPPQPVAKRGASLERVFLGLTGRSLRES